MTKTMLDDEAPDAGAVETGAPPERPPLGWLIAYRLFDRRLPARYGPWLVEDLHAKGWAWRVALMRYFHLLLNGALLYLIYGLASTQWRMLPLQIGGAALVAFMAYDYFRAARNPTAVRAEVLGRQRIDPSGAPLELEEDRRLGPFATPSNAVVADRQASALLYLVLVVGLFAGAAAIGLSRRPDTPPDHHVAGDVKRPKPERECVKIPADVMTALQRTVKAPGVTIDKGSATRYDKGLAIAVYVNTPPPTNAGSASPGLGVNVKFAGYFVEGAAATYDITLLDFETDDPTKSALPKVKMAEIVDTDRLAAFNDAVRCLPSLK